MLLRNGRPIASFNFNLIVNDPDDNKFADCALAANAHYIVTNDRDFNVLKKLSFPKIGLLKTQEFTAMLISGEIP
jgi:predicted nucleic acid-binding protein